MRTIIQDDCLKTPIALSPSLLLLRCWLLRVIRLIFSELQRGSEKAQQFAAYVFDLRMFRLVSRDITNFDNMLLWFQSCQRFLSLILPNKGTHPTQLVPGSVLAFADQSASWTSP
ncbi:predicted protein [Histoplasma capsulatum G186AR]|uniref:Uncharacterized protein n=1 Tax=Ajellomyces capsulatus (strain G186AR / H82 / ATCC MYA-2454 / RMSCC 2432) TaxID=447093 RepID=C0NNE4_AJECG|nr:uncharacterized protein HCBG_04271 [Histoplasma capsulatum G186AR]EEH07392.1 predicted protein [Histoplasma capsulatum G186AR]